MPPQTIDIQVVVNGQPTTVVAHEEHRLESIIHPALEQTHTTGQPVSNWEIRDAAGELLDVHREISSFHFAPDVRLFLNLKAGVGG